MKSRAWWARNWWRMAISVGFDVYDFTLGRIPLLGSFTDLASGFLSIALWGYKNPLAYVQFLEVADVTDQFDGFLPSLTLTGLFQLYDQT